MCANNNDCLERVIIIFTYTPNTNLLLCSFKQFRRQYILNYNIKKLFNFVQTLTLLSFKVVYKFLNLFWNIVKKHSISEKILIKHSVAYYSTPMSLFRICVLTSHHSFILGLHGSLLRWVIMHRSSRSQLYANILQINM